MACSSSRPQLEHQVAVWALKQWDEFPVDTIPRPIVLMGDRTLRIEGKFENENAHSAFRSGQFVVDSGISDEPVQILRSYFMAGASSKTVTLLRITSATKEQTVFATDRGPQRLTAWKIESSALEGVVWVLDETSLSRCWRWQDRLAGPRPSRSSTHHSAQAVIEANNTTLRFHFTGSSLQTTSYATSESLSSNTAVVVIPRPTPLTDRKKFNGYSTLAGHQREIVIELDRPLGNRVLVDWDASPIPVD